MKKLSLLLVLCLLMGTFSFAASAETPVYTQSPILDAAVEAGDLPPVEERLPKEPKLVHEILDEYIDLEIGNYGGTLRGVTTDPNNYNKYFTGMNEALLSMSSANSDEIIGNILLGYDVNDDYSEFTFYLREGLKWSDGEPVTTEDIEFTWDHFMMNPELTPSLAAKWRSGGIASADPLKFEFIDDYTFKVTSDTTYGGFLVVISIAGWAGYTDLMKPAHYLKPFHIDYAEECHGSLDAYYDYIEPFATVMGYDDVKAEGVWTYVFNQLDMTNWETTDWCDAMPTLYFEGLIDKDFPHLFGWSMKSVVNNVVTWERNPYYYKVDAAGQQLPYVDYLEMSYAEDNSVKLVMQLTGAEDFVQEEVDKYSILAENEEAGGYDVRVGTHHNIPTAIMINATYGLNPDGTLSDDEYGQAWQEVINDIRFREALTVSIDAEEMLDVYIGLAEVNDMYPCTHDIEKANALLDEMGCVDIDGDGFRETPSGKVLYWQIWNDTSNTTTLTVPFCELLVEYWTEIGLHVEAYTTEASLLKSALNANEIPMRVSLAHTYILWHYKDWALDSIAPLWNAWVKAGGLAGTIAEDDAGKYSTPDEWYIQLVTDVDSLMTVSPVEAVNEVLPKIKQEVAENMFLILPVTNCGRLMIVNNDLGNVPTGGLVYSWNMSYEFVYYRSFSYDD